MQQTFREKKDISNSLIHWPLLEEALLELALQRIPRHHFVCIFDRMSYDLGNNRTGFPDLIVFPWEHDGYELVEVKAPGDRLQANQKRWIRYFKEYEIPYRVLRVGYESPPSAPQITL